jgi:hypothetical protein
MKKCFSQIVLGASLSFLMVFFGRPAVASDIVVKFASYGYAGDRNTITQFMKEKCAGEVCSFQVNEDTFPENLWHRIGKPPPDLYVEFHCGVPENICKFHTHWHGMKTEMHCTDGVVIAYGTDENGNGCIK